MTRLLDTTQTLLGEVHVVRRTVVTMVTEVETSVIMETELLLCTLLGSSLGLSVFRSASLPLCLETSRFVVEDLLQLFATWSRGH
jgi:hypothetical protein